ncbi:restriction endonuclease [uncultured Flavobacterium sp.]|uniref:restriction endonuclease n=1 Tax=uncultured Flavobacterium sp. TaxID=165435 RepID=UPI00292DD9EF|nr:restriction endonuclease [uncultured Flavobacterium sp.]
MEDQNKLDWEKYELITKYIYETLGQDYNINIEGYGRNCIIIGNSTVKHQIDVLTSETDDTGTYRTAIECKYWNKKINKDIVMKLLAVINDSDIKRGIIVSKSGYTPDAQQFAKHNNILIVQLREAGKEDKKLHKELHFFDLILNIKINIKRPEVTNIIAKDFDNNIINLNEKDQDQILSKRQME